MHNTLVHGAVCAAANITAQGFQVPGECRLPAEGVACPAVGVMALAYDPRMAVILDVKWALNISLVITAAHHSALQMQKDRPSNARSAFRKFYLYHCTTPKPKNPPKKFRILGLGHTIQRHSKMLQRLISAPIHSAGPIEMQLFAQTFYMALLPVDVKAVQNQAFLIIQIR